MSAGAKCLFCERHTPTKSGIRITSVGWRAGRLRADRPTDRTNKPTTRCAFKIGYHTPSVLVVVPYAACVNACAAFGRVAGENQRVALITKCSSLSAADRSSSARRLWGRAIMSTATGHVCEINPPAHTAASFQCVSPISSRPPCVA